MTPEASGDLPDVTVIVPVHDGGNDLLRCLHAIHDSDGIRPEVVVVDDASSDDAVERVRIDHPAVRCVRTGDTPVGPAIARNLGAEAASGEFLVFIDADVVVAPDAIRRLVEPMCVAGPEASLAATIGSYDDRPDAPGAAATYANLRHHLVHQQSGEIVPSFWTGLGAVRRAAFESVRGFDTTFDRPSIEDVEFGLRLSRSGRTIAVVPGAQGTHLKAWTPTGLWKTDLFARAIPWGRAIATHPALATAMNGSSRGRSSILAISFGVLLGLFAGLAWWSDATIVAASLVGLAGLAFLAWFRLESVLFGLMDRHRGRATAVRGMGLHAIHHLTVPAACLLGVVMGRWAKPVDGPAGVRARGAWFVLASAPVILVAILVIAAAFAGSTNLHVRLLEMESNVRGMPIGAFEPRYDEAAVGRILGRLPVMVLPFLAVAVIVLWLGPERMTRGLKEAASCMRTTFRFTRVTGVFVGLLTAILLLAILRSGDVPMRTDEAATVMSHGLANPLVILGSYQTPNNHILHSLLVWSSIQCFGVEPWAVRLPASVFGLACVPLVAIAATRLRSELAGIVAAGIFVCLPSTLELATNARGYPIVIASMLAMIALLPGTANARSGAGICFVVAGAVGLMAVPIMAYPLAVLYSGLFIGRWRNGGFRAAMHCIPLALATVLIALSWYLPAWIASPSGSGPIGTVGTFLPSEVDWSFGEEIRRCWHVLGIAWSQWTWPMRGNGSLLILAPIGVSVLVGLRRGGPVGMLAVGIVVGPAVVLAITGFGAPPFWTLVWIPPVLIVLAASGFPWPRRSNGAEEDPSSFVPAPSPLRFVRGGMTCLIASIAVFAMSPDRFTREYPKRVWIEDAAPLAAWLAGQDPDFRRIRATGVVHGPVNYELHRGFGLVRAVEIAKGPIDDSQLPIRLLSPASAAKTSDEPHPGWYLGRRDDLVLVDRQVVDGVLVRTYDRRAND